MTRGESAILVTGSNLGDREAHLREALRLIGARCGEVTAASKVYASEPWGEVEGPDGEPPLPFLNQAVGVTTTLEPLRLLETVKDIEREMGRTETVTPGMKRKYLSRIIDIDIIFYGEQSVDIPELTIPHPLMQRREFVLVPVAEIAPRTKHPLTGLTAGQMLAELQEKE